MSVARGSKNSNDYSTGFDPITGCARPGSAAPAREVA
eukprot:gene2804-3416_t